MNPNEFRRRRSPFVYHQPRPTDELDSTHNYQSMEQFDGTAPPYQIGLPSGHPQSLPQHVQPPFMDVPAQHEYPPDYRDLSRVQPNYRMAMPHRDPFISSPVHQQPRSSSPPYKILCITNINQKISDGPVKEALSSDFGRFGDISVSICHDSGERLAYIYFRNYEEAREARNTRMRTLLFDRPIEIEPIYEPNRIEPVVLPSSPANTTMAPGQTILPSRRRSISPTSHNYHQEIDCPPSYRRVPLLRSHMTYGSPANHPGYPYHGTPPPEYVQAQPHSVGYPYAPPAASTMTSGPPIPYERRVIYEEGTFNHYPSPHAVNATSPYSTPPHEHYRPSYPPQAVPIAVHHPVREREKISTGPRSPRSEAYQQIDQRAGPLPNIPPRNHPSSRPPTHRSGRHRSRPHSRHNRPSDPPMRFMSREYRREKFGADYGPGEHEEGKPSRVLLVNNIDLSKTESDLRETFESYGTIEDMEVKKVGPEISSAIIKFSSMDGAYKAKTANNGRFIGDTRCRIVYGKVSASRKLWIGGLSPSTTVLSLEDECGRYGHIVCMEYTQGRPYCYVEFESANQAQFAAHHLKSTLTPASERKIRVEFVDPERTERLLPRQEVPSFQKSETHSKSCVSNKSSYESESSSQTNNTGGMKRGSSPAVDGSKRMCQDADLPIGSNTFKQERLAAAAAAKARSSSTASSHPSERFESKKTRDPSDINELNNNVDQEERNNGSLDMGRALKSYDHVTHTPPSPEKLSNCKSIREIIDCCSVSWSGRLALKNTIFPAQLYLCSGSKELIDKYLSRPLEDSDSQCPLLSITQRWRLHPQPKLELVKRRMQCGNLGILIITSRQENHKVRPTMPDSCEQVAPNVDKSNCVSSETQVQNGNLHKTSAYEPSEAPGSSDGTDSANVDPMATVDSRDESTNATGSTNATIYNSVSNPSRLSSTPTVGSASQSKSIRNLISYLGQKDAAGVISLSAFDCVSSELQQSTDNPPKLLYTFPPGDFALNLLRRMASNLTPEASKEEFLLGVISRGNLDGKN